MVIVGTHMDLMKEQQGVKELEEYTLKKYTGSKDTNHIYPKVTYSILYTCTCTVHVCIRFKFICVALVAWLVEHLYTCT